MATIHLPTEQITDFQSFHTICKQVFGFPDFYGMNGNAWIDCLTYLDESDGMSRFQLVPGERVYVEVPGTKEFSARVPDVFAALVEWSAFVNQRHVEDGKQPMLALIFL
ncbi:MAG: barstar family protein [Chloroflexota bacterium]|nr:barstar family protein [Chloroflexota bacterium]